MVGRFDRPSRLVVGAVATFLVILGMLARGAGAFGQREQSTPSMPERVAVMQHHFVQVTALHEAVIRGDLAGVRALASELARMPLPADTPPASAPFVAGIRAAARGATQTRDLAVAGASVALMLQRCGECHQASNVRPAPPLPRPPDVGGVVGHMLEHQAAVDALLRGLVIPSPTEWREGAARLRVTPLRADDLPADRRLTGDIRHADELLHSIAERVERAVTPAARRGAYGELLATCARCHSLHSTIWGPRRGN